MARAAAKKKSGGLAHGDRIRRRDGVSGTVIDAHQEGSRVTVLPDLGPNITEVWWRNELERTSGPARKCYRCTSTEHTAVSCGASRR